MAFCHTLELPAKMSYDGSLYVTIQNSLYRLFGPPGPGAFIEPGAVLALMVLSFLVRKRRPAFQLTLAATIFWLLAFPVVFFVFTEPVNVVFRSSTPESFPANWMQLRYQWEYSHATRFILQLLGFSALLLSVLLETPTKPSRENSQFHQAELG
ncbi:DUF1772 domain-containing protein [Fischerella sp. JS2]|uniref:DUF1772 domain-containing protein n=1 Tax=Fischerella sp. JS2 TaxID=2597771 RepID=UPI0028EFCFAC|nr:DUF1772 domain-containing protein [Fischerella sp. JS2]